MTRLEWFDKGHAQEALELGIISSSVFAKFIYYKHFLSLCQHGLKQMDAIFQTAEEMKCSSSTVFRAVSFFRN